MNDLSDNTLQKLRTIIREEVSAGIAPLKEEIRMTRLVQGSQSITLGEVRADVRNLKKWFSVPEA